MEELEGQSILQSVNIARSEAKHAQELDQPECSVDSSLPPFEEPNVEAKIRGLEELIKNLGEQKLQIIHKLDELMFERDKVIPREYLYDHNKEAKYNMANRRQEVDIFKLILKKLSSNDFERPIRSCSLSNEDVHKQKLHFRVRHGTSSLAEENKLFRLIKTSQPKEELDDPSDWLHRRMRSHRQRPEDRVGEIKHNEWNRKESVAEAIVQGKIRNSLSSNRRDIRDHIKVMNEEFEELKKEHARVRQGIACEEREMKGLDKEKCALTKQLDSISRRKDRAHRCVSELRKELVRIDLNSN